MTPQVNAERIWVKKSAIPNFCEQNIIQPTLPNINMGEEVEQKALALIASISEISPFSFKSATVFAPVGYPDKILIINA